MIYKVEMYACKCDNCGSEAFDNQDYSCWNDAERVRDEINEMNWHEVEYKNPMTSEHYCNLCWSYNDNDEVVIDHSRKGILNN